MGGNTSLMGGQMGGQLLPPGWMQQQQQQPQPQAAQQLQAVQSAMAPMLPGSVTAAPLGKRIGANVLSVTTANTSHQTQKGVLALVSRPANPVADGASA